MRAKIVAHSEFTYDEILSRLVECKWLADQTSELAQRIKNEIIEAVAWEHKQETIDNFKCVVYDYPTDAYGILCHTKYVATFRMKNKDVLSLQVSAMSLVELLTKFANAKRKSIKFETIDIMELGIRRPLIEGHIINGLAARVAYARKEKAVEYRVSKYALAITVFLMAVSFSRTLFPRAYFADMGLGPQIEWAFETIGKMIGPATITTTISFLNYRAFFKSLENTLIRWQMPKAQETFK